MKQILRIVGILVVIALVGGQAIRPARTNPPVTGEIVAPPEIARPLEAACYNCHSNETVWPWYSQVAPASWLLASDVNEGRGKLNFSEWNLLPAAKQAKKFKKAAGEIEEGEMPPWYYLPLHPEARLSDADKAALVAWFKRQAAPPGM